MCLYYISKGSCVKSAAAKETQKGGSWDLRNCQFIVTSAFCVCGIKTTLFYATIALLVLESLDMSAVFDTHDLFLVLRFVNTAVFWRVGEIPFLWLLNQTNHVPSAC